MVEAGDDDLPALGVEDEVGDVAGLRAVVGGGEHLSLGRWRQVGLPVAGEDEAHVGFWVFGENFFVGFPGWAGSVDDFGGCRGFVCSVDDFCGWVCSVDGFGGHFRFTLPFLSSWDWGLGTGPGWVIKLVWPRDSPGQSPVAVLPGRLPVVVLPLAVGGCRAGTRGASLPG